MLKPLTYLHFSRTGTTWLAAVAGTAGLMSAAFLPAHAQEKILTADKIVAIVDDDLISQYEVVQRVKLIRALGPIKITDEKLRERILKRLVNERLQSQEAKRLKIKIVDKQIQSAIKGMVQGTGQDLETVKKKLLRAGVDFKVFQDRVRATLVWNNVIKRRFARRISVDKKDVERAYKEILKKPAPTRKLVILRQVVLPFERAGLSGQVRSRQNEAMQIYRSFRGCGTLKRTTAAVFNVRIIKQPPVALKRLPPKLRAILRRIGPGRMTSPVVARGGIQMIAYCGHKIIKGPEITQKQVENQLINQQFAVMARRLLRDLRQDAVVEFR